MTSNPREGKFSQVHAWGVAPEIKLIIRSGGTHKCRLNTERLGCGQAAHTCEVDEDSPIRMEINLASTWIRAPVF